MNGIATQTREEDKAVTGSRPVRRARDLAIRLTVTAVALAIWFWTQSLIGSRLLPVTGIGDGLHRATASTNLYLHVHPTAANALLIVSSAIIDLLGIFLLSKWIFGASVRPFLGLVIVPALRQIMEALVALPSPPERDLALSGISFFVGDLRCGQ